ncbi:MAG TPA: amino acid ABC transporter permease [Actinomycetota bacterium]|nr:amino acid ABC transporter permease [Actinomycetota bacterium]
MAVQEATRPQRDLAWIRGQSNPASVAVLALGIVSVVLVTVGVALVLAGHGFTPAENLSRGLLSNELRGVCMFAVVAGALSIVAGFATFKRMPTKVSREQAFAGAVLGSQGALAALLLLWFAESDVSTFVRNYFDFERLGPQAGAFVTGMKNTLFLAFTSELFGIVLGLFVAVLAISSRSVVRAPARAYINFFRGTPLVWQLIFIGIAIPIGLGLRIETYQAAILAFSLNTGAYAAEVFRAGIRSIERGQLEAARGLGMSYMQAMRYTVIPQAVRRVIPPLMNEFVILLKDTSLVLVLGLTAAQRDLMSVGEQANSNSFNPTFLVATGLGYLAISLPLIRIVNAVENRIRSGLVGVGA